MSVTYLPLSFQGSTAPAASPAEQLRSLLQSARPREDGQTVAKGSAGDNLGRENTSVALREGMARMTTSAQLCDLMEAGEDSQGQDFNARAFEVHNKGGRGAHGTNPTSRSDALDLEPGQAGPVPDSGESRLSCSVLSLPFDAEGQLHLGSEFRGQRREYQPS